jgi:uncharacterized protein
MSRLSRSLALIITLSGLAYFNEQAASSETLPRAPGSAVATGAAVPFSGRVTDAAHILSSQFRSKLSGKLAKFERSTHHQMVVVTVSTLDGKDVADFTRDLANAWGIGRKGYDDGVVLLVAPNERKVRLAVGLGLEKKLVEPVCQRILNSVVMPRFRKGDYAGGIERGADAVIARLD